MNKDEALQVTRLVLFLKDNAKHDDPGIVQAFEMACYIVKMARLRRAISIRQCNGCNELTERRDASAAARMLVRLHNLVDDGIVILDGLDPCGRPVFEISGATKHPALRHLEKNFSDNYMLA